MVFKINIGTKEGKTYKLELESEELLGKALHDKIEGKIILPDLTGYEFEITGASDKSGFTAMENIQGIGLKKELLTYGKAFKKRPRKEGKKKLSKNKPKGLRMRKTVRGNTISEAISQINLKILKEGPKKIQEVFSDQNKEKIEEKPAEASKTEEKAKEKSKEPEKPQEAPKPEEKATSKPPEEPR